MINRIDSQFSNHGELAATDLLILSCLWNVDTIFNIPMIALIVKVLFRAIQV